MSAPRQPIYPVFGKNHQREDVFQTKINDLYMLIFDITGHIIDIEAEIALLQAAVVLINSDLAWLTANAITNFTVDSTYDSGPVGCSGFPVVDLFDPPTFTPGPHGVALTYNSRPIGSSDGSILVSYDSVCGFVNLQQIGTATLTSAGTGQSLISSLSAWPTFQLRSLISSDASIIITQTGSDEIDLTTTGGTVSLTPTGTGTSLVADQFGPDLSLKSLIAGPGITLTPATDSITVAADISSLSSLGTGESLVVSSLGPTLSVKSLTSANGIALNATADTIDISADTITLSNAGIGTSLVSPPFQLLGLSAGPGITLTPTFGSDVQISAVVSSLTTSGTGSTLISNGTSPNFALKTLSSGSPSVTVSAPASSNVVIDVPLTTLSSAGGTVSLVSDGTGPTISTKGLTAGTGLTLTPSGSDITIAAPTFVPSISSVGTGSSLISSGTGPAMVLKSIVGTGDVSVTQNASDLTISTPVQTLSYGGSAQTLISDGVGPALSLKGLLAGANTTLTSAGTSVTVATTTGYIASLASVGTGTSLVSTSLGPSVSIKGLSASTNVSLSSTSTDVTLSSSAVVPTLTSLGTGSTLISSGVAPNFTLRRLSGGAGIGITSDANTVTISNIYTLGSAAGVSFVANGVAPNFTMKGLTAGTNISLANFSGTNQIQINTTATTLTSTGGSTLVNDGTGPALRIKSLIAASSNIILTPDADNIAISTPPSTLASSGGSVSLVHTGVSPDLKLKGLTAGSGISITDNGETNIIADSNTYNTGYGELVMTTTPAAPYVLGITPTATVITPGTVASSTLLNFIRLSDGVLQYTGSVSPRMICVQATIKLWPTDATNTFTFQLMQNGSTVLDSQSTFTNATAETVNLQALVSLATNDTVSVFVQHNGAPGTINTNVIYYKLVCRHQQFSTEVGQRYGVYQGSFSTIRGVFVTATWGTVVTSHPNVTGLGGSPFTLFQVNATQRYSIFWKASAGSQNGIIVILEINGVFGWRNDSGHPVSHLAGYGETFTLHAGDTFLFRIHDEAVGSGVTATVFISSG